MDALDVISLASVKSWLNVDEVDTSQDEAITRLIKSSVDWVEKYTAWRFYQREEVVYNRQGPFFNQANYFPQVGYGEWNGTGRIKHVPGGLSIYLYPFTITSVKDKDGNAAQYTTVINALKTLLYALPNSIITLQTGFASADIGKIPPPLIDACYKWITYFFENRDMYNVQTPTDLNMMLNQYRRAFI